jgi:nucleotide-binding universal stress UspA family protein
MLFLASLGHEVHRIRCQHLWWEREMAWDGVDVGGRSSVVSMEKFGPVWPEDSVVRGIDGARTILIGTDSSQTATRAMAYGLGLARRQRSRLIIVYVAAHPRWLAMDPIYFYTPAPDVHTQIADEVRRELRGIDPGVPITFVVRVGDPFLELKRTAAEFQADAVVVGASTSSGRRLARSLASRLVSAGLWPVTVVP